MKTSLRKLSVAKETIVSRYPMEQSKSLLWSSFAFSTSAQSTMITISVMLSILHISMATSEQLNHHRHQRASSLSHHHTHYRRQRSESEPLTIFECAGDPYPTELEDWMNELTILMETEISVESSEKTSNSNMSFTERLIKFGEDLKNGIIKGTSIGDHNDSVEMTAFTNPNELWEPNYKLLSSSSGSRRGPKFRLIEKEFHCPAGRILKEFHWHPLLGFHAKIPNCCGKSGNRYGLSNMTLIGEEGNLVWSKEEGEKHVFKKEDYCIWRKQGTESSEWVSFKVCTSNCSELNPCVRKCCPTSHVIDLHTRKCIPANQRWSPIFYRTSSSEPEKNSEQQVTLNLSFIVGFPNCPIKYFINESPERNFKLLLNGTLVQTDGVKRTYINVGEFCIDGIYLSEKHNYETRGHGEYEGIVYPLSEWDQVVIACQPKNTYRAKVDKWRLTLFSILNCISALFLFVTDIVYLLLWRHQNIHGWLQFAYATSLFCTFNTFVVVQQWSTELMEFSPFLCKMLGWLTHLSYLSAFHWLTSMNFDLWWRFSRPLRTTRMTPKEKKRRRFIQFTVFSIGIPLLISSIGITLDYIYTDALLKPPYIIPGFGNDRCYFENKQTQVPYLYGPAGILLLIDLIFFTSTVFHLRKMHAHTELARTQSTMEDKKGLRVIAKLFVVMGVLWVFELASWIANVMLPDKEELLIWIFMPIDILNSLQGVTIFFIFVCKPNVGNQLLAMFRTGINRTNFLQLQQSINQSNQTNSTNLQGSNETLFTCQSDQAGRD